VRLHCPSLRCLDGWASRIGPTPFGRRPELSGFRGKSAGGAWRDAGLKSYDNISMISRLEGSKTFCRGC
jgi:hypothetical protein